MAKELIAPIVESVKKAQKQEVLYDKVYSSPDAKAGKNEFLFFIKPEITAKSEKIRLEKILDFILQEIADYNLKIHNVVTLSAPYLEKYNIIAQHYGIIHKISSNAKANLSDSAKIKFKEFYGKSINKVKAMGSLELIDRYKNFQAYTLDYLWQNLEYKKLASGTYCAPIRIDDDIIYVFNGFHPRQIKHYTKQGSNIVVMTLSGDIPWSVARNDFIGATDPEKAKKNSLRREFLERKDEFGLHEVSQSYNGVHLSAGPVEALVELKRFNSNYTMPAETIAYSDFEKALLTNFNSHYNDIVNNVITVDIDGKATSIYDFTEEKDSDEALDILKKYIAVK